MQIIAVHCGNNGGALNGIVVGDGQRTSRWGTKTRVCWNWIRTSPFIRCPLLPNIGSESSFSAFLSLSLPPCLLFPKYICGGVSLSQQHCKGISARAHKERLFTHRKYVQRRGKSTTIIQRRGGRLSQWRWSTEQDKYTLFTFEMIFSVAQKEKITPTIPHTCIFAAAQIKHQSTTSSSSPHLPTSLRLSLRHPL